MKKFRNYLVVIFSFVIFISVLVLLNPLESRGQRGGGPPGGMNVKVVNEDTEPVPVNLVQSTETDVNVVNMPTEPIQVNCVQSIEHFQETVILSFSPGENGKSGGFLVTSGKRLVIEHVSVSAALTPGQRLHETKITVLQVGGGSSKEHFLVTEFQGHRPGIADYYAASQPMRLYAIGAVSIAAFRTDDVGGSQVNVTVSGYLIDY